MKIQQRQQPQEYVEKVKKKIKMKKFNEIYGKRVTG